MQGAPRLGEKIEFYHFYIETSDYHTTNRKADFLKKNSNPSSPHLLLPSD